MKDILDGYSTKWITWQTPENYKGKGVDSHRYKNMDVTRYGNLLYMIDQVGTTTCSRNQQIAEGRGRTLTYVKMNISYHQTVSNWGLQKAPPLWPRSNLWDRQWSVTSWSSLSPLHLLSQGTPYRKAWRTGRICGPHVRE